MLCDQAKWVWSRKKKQILYFGICYLLIIKALIWWKSHGDWANGSKNTGSWNVAKIKGNKETKPLCLPIS